MQDRVADHSRALPGPFPHYRHQAILSTHERTVRPRSSRAYSVTIRRAAWVWTILATASIAAAFPTRGFGQAAPTPESAVAALKPNAMVWVTTPQSVVQGRFHALTDLIVEWKTPTGVVRTPLRDIERIETTDPIRDGMGRGALVGAGVAGAWGLLIATGLSCTRDCGPGYSRTQDIIAGAVTFAVIGAGGGAAIGAILDALVHRRRLVYARSGTSQIAFTPVIRPGQQGVTVVVSW